MTTKVIQIASLLATVIGTFGVEKFASGWANHNAMVFASLLAGAQILHALFPSIFAKPVTTKLPGAVKVPLALLLCAGLMALPARAQSVTAPSASGGVHNLYAGGASYSVGATPAVAGTAMYAHSLDPNASLATYAFTVIDALPNTVKPFTVSTNIGAGVAQDIAHFGKATVWLPTSAGISWSGKNTGWQWNGGVALTIPIKPSWYIIPNIRFLKSSVSGGTGYQPIVGVLVGFGK